MFRFCTYFKNRSFSAVCGPILLIFEYVAVPDMSEHSRGSNGQNRIFVLPRMSVTFDTMDVFVIFAHFCSFLPHFCSFLLLEPTFDCTKASGVVPDHVPGVSECF